MNEMRRGTRQEKHTEKYRKGEYWHFSVYEGGNTAIELKNV